MQNSTPDNHSSPPKPDDASLTERIRIAAELLEGIVADRSVLADIPEAERNRLLNAAGAASRPDAISRRQLLKVVKRKKRAERVEREESLPSSPGIRPRGRQPVFIPSPNIFPPQQDERSDNAEHLGETDDPRVC